MASLIRIENQYFDGEKVREVYPKGRGCMIVLADGKNIPVETMPREQVLALLSSKC